MKFSSPRKKASLGKSLAKSRAYNPIWDSEETLGEREKSRHTEKSMGAVAILRLTIRRIL